MRRPINPSTQLAGIYRPAVRCARKASVFFPKGLAMSSVSLICPDASPELVLASAHRPHLVRFYGGGGNAEAVVAAASLAAAIQVASERLAAAGVSVAEVIRDDQSGDISMLTSDSAPVVAITASELLQPPIDSSVERACVELKRGELASLVALFSPAGETATA
ncbi:MAG: hypothetical protein HZC37_23575 [Burkholderiales bacterium]|nr:hypothetical protein [Burkholderiales bacterium]